jgi:hypothetical protein
MRSKRDDRRNAVARMAARLLVEGSARDFQTARRKAAERLGIRDKAELPDNLDLQQALQAHQSLFGGDQHVVRQRVLRALAREAMEFLAAFEPRLTGPVLQGTARANDAITLHLYTDEPEAVMRCLLDNGIQFDMRQRRLRLGADRFQEFPGFTLHLDQTGCEPAEFELIVFPYRQLHASPVSAIDGKPMQRADIARVRDLLGAE